MAGIFGELFVVSDSQGTKHEKPSNISGNFGTKFGTNSGRKFKKIGDFSFCTFSDLTFRGLATPGLETPGTHFRTFQGAKNNNVGCGFFAYS